ncbi:MAG TPA: nitrilase-related carbon-nitrogen hydrolase, partial [Chloroflexota bacterium]
MLEVVEHEQQLAIAQVRAVEHGRWTMEAATSGVSAVIDPHGRVLQRTGEFTPALIDAQVRLNTSRTLSDRLGAAPEWAAALAGLAAMVLSGRRGRDLARKLRRRAGNLPLAESDQNTKTTAERDPSLLLP